MKPPAREILRRRQPDHDYDVIISECERGLWIVVYQGRPIQVRREQYYRDNRKYLPNCWTQRGGAERQARVLNKLFETTAFEIACIEGKTTD
jgi:hypothetical protein